MKYAWTIFLWALLLFGFGMMIQGFWEWSPALGKVVLGLSLITFVFFFLAHAEAEKKRLRDTPMFGGKR